MNSTPRGEGEGKRNGWRIARSWEAGYAEEGEVVLLEEDEEEDEEGGQRAGRRPRRFDRPADWERVKADRNEAVSLESCYDDGEDHLLARRRVRKARKEGREKRTLRSGSTSFINPWQPFTHSPTLASNHSLTCLSPSVSLLTFSNASRPWAAREEKTRPRE